MRIFRPREITSTARPGLGGVLAALFFLLPGSYSSTSFDHQFPVSVVNVKALI